MIASGELENYIGKLLQCSDFSDYAPNGIQIQGCTAISTICTAVTASLRAIERAIELKAQALFVHHGYFWKNEDSRIIGIKQQRIKKLLDHDISLFAYHLPLDCHLELGNNAELAKRLSVQQVKQHNMASTKNLLWSGHFDIPVAAVDFITMLTDRFQQPPIHIAGTTRPISTIAWCTGGAQDYLINAYELGVDAYISGEISERTYHEAMELGIHYFACGHHATERYGIQALGEHLKKTFNLNHTYIELENPI